MDSASESNKGAASVEYLGLAGLVGLLVVTGVAALVASPPSRGERELGEMIARRIACSGRYPVPCGRNPLALAYGLPLGKVARALAPEPPLRGGEWPVDFRYCRQPGCASPGGDRGLTASRRRVTEFVSIETSEGPARISYWLYRPGQRWERLVRSAGTAEIAAVSSLRLSLDDDPALVPLETLPGKDHYAFPAVEEPPWRWRLPSRPET